MDDITGTRPTRRALLGAGAAGAGVAALGAFDVDAALAVGGPGPDTPEGGGAGSPQGGAPAAALPPTIAGASTLVTGPFDAFVDGVGVDATFITTGGVYSSSGSLRAPIHVPPGSRVLRVDLYGYRTADGTVSANLNRWDAATATFSLVGTIVTASGTGAITGAYTTPFVVAAGEELYLALGGTNANILFSGAITTYVEPKPQLNLLANPVRVYDSRAGSPPLGVTKGQLANGATRPIDLTVGGAVPASNVRAALITLTVTNTSINWDHANESIAVSTVVATSTASAIAAYASLGSAADLIVDVQGYYV